MRFCIVADVVARRGSQRTAQDLLVGFDPVAAYVARLEARFADVAIICADYVAGREVAVKWKAKVRQSQAVSRFHL
jgi:hypothetical protein